MAQRGVNKCILVGNVGRDPEARFMPNGNAVSNLALATSEQWKDKNTGQQQERTEWHRLVAFSKLAEIINEYVRKGSKLYIEGSLRTRSWEQDGVKRYATEIVVSEMQMLDSPSQAAQQPQQQRGGQPAGNQQSDRQSAPQGAQSQYPDFDDGSDLPF